MVAKANPYYSLLFYSAKCRRAFGRNQKLTNAYSIFSLFIVFLDVKLTFSSPKCKYQFRRSRYSALMFSSILLDQSSLLSFCPDFQSPFLVCNNVTWQQCLLTKQQSVFTYRASIYANLLELMKRVGSCTHHTGYFFVAPRKAVQCSLNTRADKPLSALVNTRLRAVSLFLQI